MFNNIGGKIKTIAFLSTVIGIIASIVVGILIIIFQEGEIEGWIVGLIVAVLGSFLSWLASLLFLCFRTTCRK